MTDFSSTTNKYELWEKMKEQQGTLHTSIYSQLPELFEKIIQEVDVTEGTLEVKNGLFISSFLHKIQQKSREAYFEQRLHQYEAVETMDIYDEIRKLKKQVEELKIDINYLKNK